MIWRVLMATAVLSCVVLYAMALRYAAAGELGSAAFAAATIVLAWVSLEALQVEREESGADA